MSEIKAATDNLILSLKTSIKEMVVSNQKCVQACEQVGSIDSKVKHCNQVCRINSRQIEHFGHTTKTVNSKKMSSTIVIIMTQWILFYPRYATRKQYSTNLFKKKAKWNVTISF